MGVMDLFFERERKPEEVKSPRKTVVQPVTVSSAIQPVYIPQSNLSVLGPDYEEFKARFKKILDDENKRNYPGNDYYEFVVMKNAMNAIPQENLRYQAAFAGWSTGGNQTKTSLLNTAKIYLGLVDKEISEFESAYQQQYSQQVTKNEQLIETKTKEVQSLMERMAALNLEIHYYSIHFFA